MALAYLAKRKVGLQHAPSEYMEQEKETIILVHQEMGRQR